MSWSQSTVVKLQTSVRDETVSSNDRRIKTQVSAMHATPRCGIRLIST